MSSCRGYRESSPEPPSSPSSGKPRPPAYAHPSPPASVDSAPVAVCAGCNSSAVQMGGAMTIGQPMRTQPGQTPVFFFSPAQPTAVYPSLPHGALRPDQTVYAAAQPMVVATTSDPLNLRDRPALISCQKCGTTGYSVLRSVPSVTTHCYACMLCVVFWPCACLPYLSSGSKDVRHSCPGCRVPIATWKRNRGVTVAHQLQHERA